MTKHPLVGMFLTTCVRYIHSPNDAHEKQSESLLEELLVSMKRTVQMQNAHEDYSEEH